MDGRAYRVPVVVAAFLLCLAGRKSDASPGDMIFTDWIGSDANGPTAFGTLGSASVTLTGSPLDLRNLPYCYVTDGSSNIFSRADYFNPPLPLSDEASLRGCPNDGAAYTITFSQPVLNPVLHLASLASILTFEGVNPALVSGTVQVSGNTVVGSGNPIDRDWPWYDWNGTVMLPGVFSTIDFIAWYGAGVYDGFYMQIGWVPVMHTLAVTKTNGQWGEVSMDPEPNDANLPTFVFGTPVTLTATPISGKSFKQWEIYDPNYPGDANHAIIDANATTTIVMDSDKSVGAVFKCGSGAGPMLPLTALGLLGMVAVRRRL